MVLIITRAQDCTITQNFCEEQRYEIHPVKQMCAFRGNRGITIPYLRYMEATVRIPPIKGYDECIQMLTIKFSPYSSRVPIQLVTTVLDRAMARITLEELAHASDTWQQTYMSTMVTTKAAGTFEIKNEDILTIDAHLVANKPTMGPSLWMQMSKGTGGTAAFSQLPCKCNCRTNWKSSDNMGGHGH